MIDAPFLKQLIISLLILSIASARSQKLCALSDLLKTEKALSCNILELTSFVPKQLHKQFVILKITMYSCFSVYFLSNLYIKKMILQLLQLY